MAYNTDQVIEQLRRDVAELATILAGSRAVTRDRATQDRFAAIAARHNPPRPEPPVVDPDPDDDRLPGEDFLPWERPSLGEPTGEDDPPEDDLTTPARPA